jgi:flagellar protein FlgJ
VTVQPIDRAAAASAAKPAASMDASRVVAPETGKPAPYVQFEAFVLQSFIQAILPKDAAEVFGEGTAGEVWKSMLAEKMALQVAEAGGVGIAKMIAPKGGSGAAPSGLPGQAATATRLLDLQLSAVGGVTARSGDATKTKAF